MQIGNFHIGFAETAVPPVITSSEVYQLWDNLVIRYDLIELFQLYVSYIHDPDFKTILENDITDILEKQVNVLEDELSKYKIPLPERPPKSITYSRQSVVLTDEFMFQRTLTSFQDFIEMCTRSIRASVAHDQIRSLFIEYFEVKLEAYNFLCKLGKAKGWLELPPMMPKSQ